MTNECLQDLGSLTLSELRSLGEELAIPGLNQIRNRTKEHLAKYIGWWMRLTQMEQDVEPPDAAPAGVAPGEAAGDSSMLDPTHASSCNCKLCERITPQKYLDEVGHPCKATPWDYTYSVEWDDWRFGEGHDGDGFHYLDLTHRPTNQNWMLSLTEWGRDFWEAFEKLTRTIKTLEFDIEEDAIYYRCFNFQILPKATRLKLATLSALAVTLTNVLWVAIAKDCDHPGGNCRDRWNPAHFGEVTLQFEQTGQLLLPFSEPCEPPDPDDFAQRSEYEHAWAEWEKQNPNLVEIVSV